MIGFVGLSHLGIVYGAATAAKGFDVLGFDPNPQLCEDLSDAKLPVTEPGLDDLFATHRERLRFTSEVARLAACEVVFFSLDVPTDAENRSDLGPLRKLIARTAAHIAPTATVVILCQVPPGFTRTLSREMPQLGGALFYQVETLIFGNAVERALRPERYIVGCGDPGAPLTPAYAKWLAAFGCPVLPMRYESAELSKIAINFFLVSTVSTTNTLAEVCENSGADWNEIAPALRLDARIGPKAYLTPGLGISGGNLERDLATVQRLAEGSQADTGIVDAWQRNSAHRKDWTARTLRAVAKKRGLDLNVAVVAVWGLAYKENTHSVKNSPSLHFIAAFPEAGKLTYDPVVKLSADAYPRFAQLAAALDCCRAADALVIATPWPEFRAADLKAIRAAMRGRIILDPFSMLDGGQAAALGFEYHRLGVPPRSGAQ